MRTVKQLQAALRAKPGKNFDADATRRTKALADLATYGEAALPALDDVLAQLSHGHHEVESHALGVIARLETEIAATQIIARATQPTKRPLAIRALKAVAMHHELFTLPIDLPAMPLFLALRRATPVLIATVGNAKIDDFIRQEAIYALGLLGRDDDDAFAALKRAVSDSSHWVRDRTAYALRYFGTRATTPLRRLLRDGYAGTTAAKSLQLIDAANKANKRNKPKRKKPNKPNKPNKQ